MTNGVTWRVIAVTPFLFASCGFHVPKEAAPVERMEVAAASNREAEVPEPATVPFVMFSDKLHTGLVLDLKWLRRNGYVPPKGTPDRKWAAFSWGDETAYVQQSWLSIGQVFQALATPTPSVMEIITFDWNIPNICHHQRLYQTYVPESAGRNLAAFLNHCAVRDAEGYPETIAPASWGSGRLIKSRYTYYFPRICNTWTVDALNSAGFRVNRLFGLPADGVIGQAKAKRNGFAKIWDPSWQMGDSPPE